MIAPSFFFLPKPDPEAQPQHSSSPARKKPQLKIGLIPHDAHTLAGFFLTDSGAGPESESEYQRMLDSVERRQPSRSLYRQGPERERILSRVTQQGCCRADGSISASRLDSQSWTLTSSYGQEAGGHGGPRTGLRSMQLP